MKKILILFLSFILTASFCLAESEFKFFKKNNMTYKYNSKNEIVQKFKISKNPENNAIYIEVMTKDDVIENKYRINYWDKYIITKAYDQFGKVLMFYKSFIVPEGVITEIYSNDGNKLESYKVDRDNIDLNDYIICDKYGKLKGLKESLPDGKILRFRITACDVPYRP